MILATLVGSRERAPPHAPDGTRVYAVGDVHGRADLLDRMHAMIRTDADRAPASRRVVVYIGDYVDRGLQSREVIESLCGDPLPGFERIHLTGNHDAWMLRFLEDAEAGPGWMHNGGTATLLSYGVGRVEAAGLNARMQAAQEQLAARLPAHHLAFLRSLRHWHVEGDYLFVHAGIRPGVPIERQSPHDLLWIREEFLLDDTDHGRIVVHGHSIVEAPEELPNRIAIDTGAFATGRLTCLVLDGIGRRFLQT